MVRQWNYTIREAVNQAQFQRALFLFCQMMQKSLQPNHLTFPIIAKAAGKLKNIHFSKIIHAQILKSPFSDDIYVQTAMMDMYIKSDCMNIAYEVFSRMSRRDIASWNSLLLGFAQLGIVDEVFSLFKQMRVERIQPDSVTVIGISQSITSREGVGLLKTVHSFGIRMGVEIDVLVSNTWVSSYAKVRDLVSAEKVFHGIEPCFVTVVSWNSMIAGYGYFEKSFSFYKKMLYGGFKPDISTNLNLLSSIRRPKDILYGKLIHCHGIKMGCDLDTCVPNTLISMYSKCGDLSHARQVFDAMVLRTCVSWTAMISGYAEKGDLDGALALFHSMDAAGVKPDLVTVLSVIAGCGETGALEIGRWVEDYARLNGLRSNMMVLNALIDMYAKCGSIKEACEIFYMMSERTVVSWTSMIAACALNGEFEEALTHFSQMLEHGVKPNHITFLAVLQACNHGGFIEKGWEIYDLMMKVHKLDPGLDHYSSMADLLGRAGKLNEALDFIQNMPMKPDAGIWSSLLSACKIYRNVEIGELAACRLFEMEPRAAAPYVEMANIYASTSCWDGVSAIRRLMKQKQVTKYPGQSTIRVNGKTHKFTVEDWCHHKAPVIYEILDGLALESKYELDGPWKTICEDHFVLNVSVTEELGSRCPTLIDTQEAKISKVELISSACEIDKGEQQCNFRFTSMQPYPTKLTIRVNGHIQQVASCNVQSHQGSIKEEPIDIDGFNAPPKINRKIKDHKDISRSTSHGDLNENIIDLSSSDDENTPSCNDSQKQLVLYDPCVNSGGAIEAVPDPISYIPPSYPRHHHVQRILPSVGAFTVQCANCFKWRLIPSQEKYEEIREHITEKPFVCETAHEWRPDVSCKDPPDIEQDGSRLWAIDKPNIAQTPPGWQRDLRIRGEGSTKFADVYECFQYYTAPTGNKLRSIPDVEKYLFKHPEYVEHGVTLAQFSFQIPKPLQENYVRKRTPRVAALREAKPLAVLPGPEQNTELQLGLPGFSARCTFDPVNPAAKRARSASGVKIGGYLVKIHGIYGSWNEGTGNGCTSSLYLGTDLEPSVLVLKQVLDV
ncbi:hypothetical protein OSB04_031190 [Centaurea solstitialis]|uniref:Uncharacterized protein n=1 Tax=Centaurea solstitialis TaxID=347529 RepID=A0AA38VXD1_9ASTR|nr:hypothetical protein OSB04_031190 [Centaurea solstitialis]